MLLVGTVLGLGACNGLGCRAHQLINVIFDEFGQGYLHPFDVIGYFLAGMASFGGKIILVGWLFVSISVFRTQLPPVNIREVMVIRVVLADFGVDLVELLAPGGVDG